MAEFPSGVEDQPNMEAEAAALVPMVELALAEAEVAKARDAVEAATAALKEAKEPGDIANAEAALAKAEATLAKAEATARLEADGAAAVGEMRALLSALKEELDPEAFKQVASTLVEGYFPAFANVPVREEKAGQSSPGRLTAEDNLFQAKSSLTPLATRFGVNGGDVNTLTHLLENWARIQRRNPEIAARVGAKITALQPEVPPVEEWVPPATDADLGYEERESRPGISDSVRRLIVKALGEAVGVGQGLYGRAKGTLSEKVSAVFPGLMH